jgi:hypothetical protein
MKMLAEYLDMAMKFERMAATEANSKAGLRDRPPAIANSRKSARRYTV